MELFFTLPNQPNRPTEVTYWEKSLTVSTNTDFMIAKPNRTMWIRPDFYCQYCTMSNIGSTTANNKLFSYVRTQFHRTTRSMKLGVYDSNTSIELVFVHWDNGYLCDRNVLISHIITEGWLVWLVYDDLVNNTNAWNNLHGYSFYRMLSSINDAYYFWVHSICVETVNMNMVVPPFQWSEGDNEVNITTISMQWSHTSDIRHVIVRLALLPPY